MTDLCWDKPVLELRPRPAARPRPRRMRTSVTPAPAVHASAAQAAMVDRGSASLPESTAGVGRESVALSEGRGGETPGGAAAAAAHYSVCSAAFCCCRSPPESAHTPSGCGERRQSGEWRWWERVFCFQWSPSVYHNALSIFFWTGVGGCCGLLLALARLLHQGPDAPAAAPAAASYANELAQLEDYYNILNLAFMAPVWLLLMHYLRPLEAHRPAPQPPGADHFMTEVVPALPAEVVCARRVYRCLHVVCWLLLAFYVVLTVSNSLELGLGMCRGSLLPGGAEGGGAGGGGGDSRSTAGVGRKSVALSGGRGGETPGGAAAAHACPPIAVVTAAMVFADAGYCWTWACAVYFVRLIIRRHARTPPTRWEQCLLGLT
eukprot:SAG22_NODE_585_length_8867_cov_11.509580_4_plen_377_part_00